MNTTTKPVLSTIAAVAALPLMAVTVPTVSSVTMTQPESSRRVTISYKIDAEAVVTIDVQTNATANAEATDPGWTSIGGAAVCNATGDVWKKVSSGSHTITWRPDLSWPDHKVADGCARAVVTAWALDNTPDYMAVDVSSAAQPDTQSYYPAADFVPGGVSNGLYKTTMLLMRKIMAKDVKWTMGSTTLETQERKSPRENTHQVSLTNNYYIGVYEVTWSQWSQIATNSGASAYFTTDRFMRPVDFVSYNEICNTYATSGTAKEVSGNMAYCWPHDPKEDSFLGLLRSKTGLDFNLPSEAEWEFAARAGNGSGYWGDGSAMQNTAADANLNLLGRYLLNPSSNTSAATTTIAPADGGTAIVGSYKPNSWGIYDMHGNVWEWCLDWYQENITSYNGVVNVSVTDNQKTYNGASNSDYKRVMRGGGYSNNAGYSRPAWRNDCKQNSRYQGYGFRVACKAGLQ